jgi:hypothetical protein
MVKTDSESYISNCYPYTISVRDTIREKTTTACSVQIRHATDRSRSCFGEAPWIMHEEDGKHAIFLASWAVISGVVPMPVKDTAAGPGTRRPPKPGQILPALLLTRKSELVLCSTPVTRKPEYVLHDYYYLTQE